MKELIDKAAVVAWAKETYLCENASMIRKVCYNQLLNFLDTLEVKEVDLEKEIELVKGDYEQVDVAWNNDFEFIAHHFFELGLKAQKGE